MTQEADYFNLQMTNIFIGLICKQHPLLQPHAGEVRKLGYELHKIEPSFLSVNGTVNPEAIAFSTPQSHTLLTEWTTSERLGDQKETQISKYLAVNSNELCENAGLESNSATSHSVWLVVTPNAVTSFKQLVNINSNKKLLLCSFERLHTGEFCMKYHDGGMQDTKLSNVLAKEIVFKRVPEGYLPFSLDNLKNNDRFTDGVVREVISLAVRKAQDFESRDICISMYPIWDYISAEKQTHIRSSVKSVLAEVSKKKHCRGWLVYNSPKWEIKNPTKSNLKKLLDDL